LEEVASSSNVRAMPTFKVYQNGEEVEELVGADRDGLLEMIQKYA
jgi:thiol-disulfide isomerase/thioredoxin